MICKKCGAEINDDSAFCLKCGQPVESDATKRVCPRCGQEVENDSQFCNKCGFDFNVNVSSKKCPSCGTILDNNVLFCNKCGFSFQEKKEQKKFNKNIIAIIAIVVILIGGIGGYLAYSAHQRAVAKALYEEEQAKEQERQQLIYSYECKAKEIYDEIKGCSSDFSMLESMFDISTDTSGGLLGPSFFIDYSKSLCASEISAEKTRMRTLDTLMDELEGMECDEPEIKDLESAITEYYEAYKERYDVLVDGDFSSYTFDNLNSSTQKNLIEREENVSALLDNIDFSQNIDNEITDSVENEEASDL